MTSLHHDPVSRTLGATDSPRESSTDVDPMASELVEAHIRIAELETLNAAHEITIASLNERLPEFARLHSELSSTRTALQQVREAATALDEDDELALREFAGYSRLRYPLTSKKLFAVADDIAALRALTSTETTE